MIYDAGVPALRAARLDQWWKPKASNLLSVAYWVFLLTARSFGGASVLLIPAFFTILGIGCFGHFINDLYDIDTDRKAGKANSMAAMSYRRRALYLGAALSVALLPWLFLPFDAISICLLALEMAALLIYALPPIRLKGSVLWSIPADGAYAFAIPALLSAHTFLLAAGQHADPPLTLVFFCWQLSLGIRQYLNHLSTDRSADSRAGIQTLATRKGNAFIHRMIRRVILPAELLALAAGLWIVGDTQRLPVLIVPAAWLLFYGLPNILSTDGYAFMAYRFSGITLDRFYQHVFPLIPLCFLVAHDRAYLIIIAGHLLLLRPSLYRRAYQVGIGLVWFIPVPLLSSVKRALLSFFRPEDRKGQPPAIVVANINKQKYTETFINEMVPRLKYRVHSWYGAELPEYYEHPDGKGRSFLPEWKFLRMVLSLIENVARHPDHYFLKQKLCNYLQYHRVKLLLAEFGPVGVALCPIVRDTATPLVVYFHGYDVYNRKMLDRYAPAYPDLFREARKIIAVSEDMIARLLLLGASADKLVHLPAFVNLGLFPYSDRRGFPPRFLAVGRFSETKSPHLTLLAFHKVVQRIPGATLTMVGKGGGGELFEACVILARSLGIEGNVIFRGVLSHADTAFEMQKARVFVQHSLTTPEHQDKEGKPVAIMEAMSAGLPVIATRHSGIQELICSGKTGMLVEEYDIEAMANAMILLAEDDELVGSLGLRASEFIHHHPLVARSIQLLEELIDQCLDECS